MRFQVSLLQVIGLFLFYAAFGYLIPLINISLNPFEAAPLWTVTSDLSVLLIGGVLALLAGRFTSKFQPTRLQWLGVSVLSLVLFMGADLLSSHTECSRPEVLALVPSVAPSASLGCKYCQVTHKQVISRTKECKECADLPLIVICVLMLIPWLPNAIGRLPREVMVGLQNVEGIDLFSHSGPLHWHRWIPSLKTGSTVRQPFCSQLEERLLLW
jgi:hypothetical protein